MHLRCFFYSNLFRQANAEKATKSQIGQRQFFNFTVVFKAALGGRGSARAMRSKSLNIEAGRTEPSPPQHPLFLGKVPLY